ncbi:MAG: GAF domain-containing protein [Elusimicrobia bacterium]|nr:GAF domain-containing protein [Elusimicrobiota bacterium]
MPPKSALGRRELLLAQFGRKVAIETRLDSLLEILAEEVRTILSADRCTVFVVDKRKGELWSKVAHGLERKEIRIPIGKGIAGYVAKSGEPINIKDAYQDMRFSQEQDKATGYKTNNMLVTPLKNRGGEPLGVFQVLNKKKGSFDEQDEGFLQLLSTIAATAIENAQLYESLKNSHLETIYRLAVMAEYRDQEDTAKHLRHISKYSAVVADRYGLPYDQVEDIRYASPLHDIGKVAIPDAILKKAGKLTPEEYEEMKKHPEYGAKVLEGAESGLLKLAYRISIAHHEKFDGTGYPKGLKGENIPLEARIISVVDVFDALTTKRVYKRAWDTEEAGAYIRERSSKDFDPGVVDAFNKSFSVICDLIRQEELAEIAKS